MTKYFTQWDGDTIGATEAGWTQLGGATTAHVPAYANPSVNPIKRRYSALTPGGAGTFELLQHDASAADANRANFDICTLIIGALCTATTVRVAYARGQGTGTVTDYYAVSVVLATGVISLLKRVASANSSITTGTDSTTITPTSAWFVRFRGNGTTLQVRVWPASLGMAGEPTTWAINTTDASLSAAGWLARGGFGSGLVTALAFWSVGTNGDSAVCPRTNTEYQSWLASQSAKRCVLAEFTGTGYDPTGAPYTKTVNARISNMGFTSAPQDTPANIYYPDVIKSIPSFSRVLNTGLAGASTTNFGDLIVDNSRPASQPQDVTTMGLKFDGVSQRVTLSATTNIPAAFTIEAWVKITTVATGFVQLIFIATDAGNSNYVSFFVDSAGSLTLNRVAGGATVCSVTASGVFPFGNQLVHLAATVGDGGASNAKIFVNGTLLGSSSSWSAASITQPAAIGATPAGVAAIAGNMDEVRLWNTARTAAQILAYKNTRATGAETGLIGCWHFDEGIGTTTADASPTGNTGTLTSATMWSMTGMPKSNTAWGGERDDWLRVRWKRTSITMWLGDPSWPRHDFRALLVGRIGQPTAPSQDTLRFQITDMMDVFNTLLTSTLTNGPYYPYLMGNMGGMIEPPEIDTALLKFQISNGAILAQTGGVQAIAYDNLVAIQAVAGITVSTVTGGNLITASAAHGMVANYRVVFGASPPTGLTAGTNYWVIATGLTTTAFQVSATRGGAAVALTNATGIGCTITGYGYDFDETNGTMTLAAAHVGRVTVTGVRNNNLTAGYVDPLGPADVYNQLVFGTQGLALSKNFQDAASFTALDVANTSHSQALGVWMDSQRHTVADALAELAKMTYTIYGFTFDGLMQIAQLGLPGTAVATFTEDDVAMGSLKMTDGIRAIDFSKTTGFYAKWYTSGGAFSKQTPESIALGKALAAYSYGASSVPLDNYPPLADSDGVTEFRSATTAVGTSTTGALWLRIQIANLYQKRLGVFEFQTTMAALAPAVTLGATIALQHSRLGCKVFSNTDPSSPDAVSVTSDATLMVVSGITVNLESGGAFPVTIRGYRPLPGYYSMTDL